MKLLGLLIVGFVALVAVIFMLFSVGIFSDGDITGKVTGVCNSFSSDLILYLISGNPSLPTLDIGSQGI